MCAGFTLAFCLISTRLRGVKHIWSLEWLEWSVFSLLMVPLWWKNSHSLPEDSDYSPFIHALSMWMSLLLFHFYILELASLFLMVFSNTICSLWMHFYYLVFCASSGVVMCFSGVRVSFAMFLLVIEVFYWLLLFALDLVFNLKQFFCCCFFSLMNKKITEWWLLRPQHARQTTTGGYMVRLHMCNKATDRICSDWLVLML